MITGMTSPMLLQGSVEGIAPTRMTAPHAAPAHAFFNTVRDLVVSHGYHTEQGRLDALASIDRYEKQVISSGDLQQVFSENDRAPYEDVRLRKGPSNGQPAPVMVPGGIDYNLLAAALIAAQQAQMQAQQGQPGPAVPATGA